MSLYFSEEMQRLKKTDLYRGLIRLSCKSGQIAFSGVIGKFNDDVSFVTPINANGIDQLQVMVVDPSRHNLIALQTQFKL